MGKSNLLQWSVNKSMALASQLLHSALKKAGHFIYPNICLQCDAPGSNRIDLCERCFKSLPWVHYACQRCALSLTSGNANLCGACRNKKFYFDHVYAPFQFEGFIRDAVYQFKFNQKLNQGKLLAHLFIKHIEKQQLNIPEIIIPVPLHKNRIHKRGYNQALEIARIVSKEIDNELSYREIYRNRDTGVQMELPAKQRHKNVKDAFSLKENSTIFKNKHVCIMDDVVTTGNTVNEVAKNIKSAGAKRIDVWCIARVS